MSVRDIDIVTFNARSIRNRRSEILSYVRQFAPHIVLIQETYLSKLTKFYIPGYTLLRSDRDETGGGLAILIKNGLKFKRTNDKMNSKYESMSIELYLNNTKVTITNIHLLKQCRSNDLMLRTCAGVSNHIMGGDFNAICNAWSQGAENVNGKIIAEIVSDGLFNIHAPNNITRPNFHGSASTIDFYYLMLISWKILK